jgi:hypothetical protein
MDSILKEFVKKHGKELISEKLNENFLLHLICLYEHQQITNNTFADVIRLFNELQL